MKDVPSGSIDLVFSYATFVHFDPELVAAYLKDIRRVLAPGGRLLFHHAFDLGNRQSYFRYMTVEQVDSLLADAGLVREGPELLFGLPSAGARGIEAVKPKRSRK